MPPPCPTHPTVSRPSRLALPPLFLSLRERWAAVGFDTAARRGSLPSNAIGDPPRPAAEDGSRPLPPEGGEKNTAKPLDRPNCSPSPLPLPQGEVGRRGLQTRRLGEGLFRRTRSETPLDRLPKTAAAHSPLKGEKRSHTEFLSLPFSSPSGRGGPPWASTRRLGEGLPEPPSTGCRRRKGAGR